MRRSSADSPITSTLPGETPPPAGRRHGHGQGHGNDQPGRDELAQALQGVRMGGLSRRHDTEERKDEGGAEADDRSQDVQAEEQGGHGRHSTSTSFLQKSRLERVLEKRAVRTAAGAG